MRSLRRPEQHGDAASALGGDLQTAQLRIFRSRRRPREHRAAGVRAQGLLDGPERLLRRARLHDQHVIGIDARCGERRRIGKVGRGDPRDETPLARELCERWTEKAQFADALVRGQDFGERACRPAAARQRRVERREPRAHARARDLREVVAAPDVVATKDFAEGFVQGWRAGHAGKAGWPPSSSTTRPASMQAKSTMYRSIGCWRRNLAPPNWRMRRCRHRARSASVISHRSRREKAFVRAAMRVMAMANGRPPSRPSLEKRRRWLAIPFPRRRERRGFVERGGLPPRPNRDGVSRSATATGRSG